MEDETIQIVNMEEGIGAVVKIEEVDGIDLTKFTFNDCRWLLHYSMPTRIDFGLVGICPYDIGTGCDAIL